MSKKRRNEADTRADLIDPALIASGWTQLEHSYIRREVICPGRILTGNKRGSRVAYDYILEYRGKKLAVVEAKKEGLSYTEGVRQAKDESTWRAILEYFSAAVQLGQYGVIPQLAKNY